MWLILSKFEVKYTKYDELYFQLGQKHQKKWINSFWKISTSLFKLIKEWQESFDIILIDTPPILGISDAKLIASKTDGVLLVVRLEQTIKDSIRLALHELNLGNLNLLGLVANGAKRYGSGYYYNNYYYRNRYYSPKKRLKQMEES